MWKMQAFAKARREIGRRIRAERKAKKFTQGQLGARAGLSGKFVGEVERGGNSTVTAVLALAHALSIPAAALFATTFESPGRILAEKDEAEVREAVRTLARIFPTRRRKD
jgi:transcriptional regulator with XRE-family HTH domain